MEEIGCVNRYTCNTCSHYVNVMLLNTGTTCFSMSCPECLKHGRSDAFMSSGFYRIRIHGDQLCINKVMFRPRKLPENPALREHVLMGALVSANLGEPIDPLYPDCGDVSYPEWRDYAKQHWGVEPEPLL